MDGPSKPATPRDAQYEATSPWQIYSLADELQLKKEAVRDTFLLAEVWLPEFEIATDGKDYFYRNKMEYALYWDNAENKIKLAVHKRRSYKKLPIKSSSLERPEILARAFEIIDNLNARGEQARKYQSLMLRCNQEGEVAGGLFENGQPHPIFPNLTDEILGQKYSYSPNGFFQINLPVYEMALLEIARWVQGETVLDLYAGVGTIGLSVARDRNLTLVESNASAIKEAKVNAKDTNAEVILAKSEEALGHIAGKDTVIVDPPRAGLHESVVAELLQQQTPRVIYLSCNPETQARDVKMLLNGGYKIDFVKAFDFFPHTLHIENLVILSL
ncbi:MAG: methyltransferase [Candidatus Nomurabacteria bacterium]|jgi:23S rRNA (uracil1939-C5)-methyltransferase|nr:methyltransferase [Candidatus Nomurabacteria bacterium]